MQLFVDSLLPGVIEIATSRGKVICSKGKVPIQFTFQSGGWNMCLRANMVISFVAFDEEQAISGVNNLSRMYSIQPYWYILIPIALSSIGAETFH